ncbi:MAG: SHOCT domain-containing protein [Solirubrobacteraceae bacterium]
MFGRGRRTGVAKVIARRYDPGSTWTARRVGYDTYVYVLDVTPDSGEAPFRVEAHITLRDTPEFTAPGIGDSARVTFNDKHEHVEFDVDALERATAAAHDQRDAEFAALAAAPPGTGVPASAGAPLDPELQALMDSEERERNAAAAQPPSPGAGPAAAGPDPVARLEELADLHARGVLSDAEFAAEKSRILSE